MVENSWIKVMIDGDNCILEFKGMCNIVLEDDDVDFLISWLEMYKLFKKELVKA